MARLMLYKNAYADTTVVSNCFIDDYMKEANAVQVKVYLYLLRMLNADQAVSVSDIADHFNETEKDILRALTYWEDKQLFSLDYDAMNNLTGIRLLEPGKSQVSPVRNQAPQAAPVQPVAEPVFQHPAGFSAAPAVSEPVKPAFIKPEYSMDQLQNFSEKDETAQLLFIAQSYLGKPLTPAEMKSLLFMMDVLHFSEDLIDYLIQYCVDRGKKDFKYIEKVAVNWAEQGISTPEEAKNQSYRYDKNVYAIMNQLGKNTSPTDIEIEYITRWLNEYGFTMDIIFEACQRTVMATDKHRFEYADSILSSWKKENVHRKSDIIRIDESFQSRRRSALKTAGTNKFTQFKQNDYDFDQLERELLSN